MDAMRAARTAFAAFALTVLCTAPLPGAWQAGAAARDLTPPGPIWLAGYASRTKPSESVRQHIYAKALALRDDAGATTIAVTLDLIGIRTRMADELAARALKELGVPRERLLFNASHTHSAPVPNEVGTYASIMGPQREAQEKLIAAYVRQVTDQIFDAMRTAAANLKPATLHFEQGLAGFAVNRRRVGHREYPSPVDHDVPVLAVRNTQGGVVAILFGYACHNTILADQTIHGDYAGYAQASLEQRFPGAVALFMQGAGADQNPLPRRRPEHLARYGDTLADAVEDVVRGKMKAVEGPLRATIAFPEVAFEGPFTRERWERETRSAQALTREHGQRMLARLDRTGKLPETRKYAVQAWRFGQTFTLIALAGELTVDYALRFKQQFGWDTTWVAGYSNDVFGYIPSRRIWREGGYEGGEAFLFSNFPGRLTEDTEDRIATAVTRAVAALR